MMQDQPIELPWEAPGWFEEATTWIHAQLATHGWRTLAPVELVRLRPWSALARVPTNHGLVYFKAPAPEFRYEAALTQALARRRPDCTVQLLAVDLARGWLLSADAGPTLHDASPSTAQLAHWPKLLALCVELQLALAAHVPELLAMGVFDRRLALFPQLYNELMAGHENLRVGLEPGLTQTEYARLRALRPWVADACAQVAAVGLPETLVHEEVHSSNVLFNGDRFIFIDWSEAIVGHPFFLLLVTMRATAARLELAEDGPEMIRLRDAYLEPWTAFATRKTLLTALAVANRLSMATRALSWHHGTGSLSQRYKAAYAESVPNWLRDFLNAETPDSLEQKYG
ncbi:MAG: phosphotransferase [Caldilineaceae bacterium]